MASTVDLGQRLELRDASGSVLGYFLPVKDRECAEGQPGDLQQTEARREPAAQTCMDLAVERDSLLKENARLRAERDLYLKSLYAVTGEEIAFDKEVILANVNAGKPLEQLLDELEATKGA